MYPRMIQVEGDLSRFMNDPPTEDVTCIAHQMNEQEDVHTEHGWSDYYVNENTIINQKFFENEDLSDIADQLKMDIKSVSVIRQPPGQVIPIHRDIFYQIKKKYDVTGKFIARANIHLNEWCPGHIIQYERQNKWHNWTHWNINQGLMLDEHALHIGINGGTRDKWTLQLSGFLARP
tara:strand:+ start:206 stop:736 length:531 start_codon:yes stop_codon:yes gene_type:complete